MSNNSWRTPLKLFKELDKEFCFQLDPCTSKHNNLGLPYFYTKEDDGLKLSWSRYKRIFINPPYGYDKLKNGKRGEYLLEKWVQKAYNEFYQNNLKQTIVMLLPATVSTQWFHKYIWDDEIHKPRLHTQIRFPLRRIQYLNELGVKQETPRFDSMIIIFKEDIHMQNDTARS